MRDQFTNTQFMNKDHERAILREEAENNRKTDETLQKRLQERKQKELEAKLVLDQQVQAKKQLKEIQLAQKQADFD